MSPFGFFFIFFYNNKNHIACRQLLVESTKLNDDMVGIVKGLVSAGIDISTVLPADGGAEWQVQLQEAASAMSSVVCCSFVLRQVLTCIVMKDPAKYNIDEIYGLYMENVLVQSSVNVLALSVLHWVYTIGNLLTGMVEPLFEVFLIYLFYCSSVALAPAAYVYV